MKERSKKIKEMVMENMLLKNWVMYMKVTTITAKQMEKENCYWEIKILMKAILLKN